MKTFKITYGIGEGFGNNEEIIKAASAAEARALARQKAIEEYERYEGQCGIRSSSEIEEEDGVDWLEAEEIYKDEMESALDYYEELYNEEKGSVLEASVEEIK
jgi:hypothetical protein